MGAYEEARSRLPASALAIADELIALAPPLTPEQERTIQRALGPYVLPPDGQPAQAADRAEQIRRIVDQAPLLSPETRRRLRPILSGALRTLAEIEAAGAALAATWPPLTQAQADRVAAILAPFWPAILRARDGEPAVARQPARARGVRHLTTTDLAERWHTTPNAIRTMNSRGTGPDYMRVGKRALYRLADVEAWEKSRMVRQDQPSPDGARRRRSRFPA